MSQHSLLDANFRFNGFQTRLNFVVRGENSFEDIFDGVYDITLEFASLSSVVARKVVYVVCVVIVVVVVVLVIVVVIGNVVLIVMLVVILVVAHVIELVMIVDVVEMV